MEYLIDIGLFVAKAGIIVIAVVVILGSIAATVHRNHDGHRGRILITDLSEQFRDLKTDLLLEILDKKAFKKYQKSQKKQSKQRGKSAREDDLVDVEGGRCETEADPEMAVESSVVSSAEHFEPRIFVINFDGDVNATEVEALREEVTAVIAVARKGDKALLRLESPGGVVHGYGHAASQLLRLKAKGLDLTVAVDEIAASGGYMMACVADHILAAPFALVGSIGVVAELPNFHRLLQKYDVDIEQHTAGEYKRTLTTLGQNTEKGRQKFIQELEEAHTLFKNWVTAHRPQMDLAKIATGEHWFGQQALELLLVDELGTSDDWVLEHIEAHRVYEVVYEPPKQLGDRFSRWLQGTLTGTLQQVIDRNLNSSSRIH